MAAVTVVAALAVPTGSAAASGDRAETGRDRSGAWSGAWSASQHKPAVGTPWDGPNWSIPGFTADQSVRQVVRVTTGGSRVRIRLSNRYGTGPLRVAGATIAKAGHGAAIRPGTVRRVTFGRSASTTIPAGRDATSDAAWLVTAPLEKLTVTLYFAKPTGPATFHELGLTTTYRATGDRRFDQDAGAFAGETSHSWYYLTGVDVAGGAHRADGTVVTFGDSITDGFGSTPGADNRFPDELAERLTGAHRPMGVLNAGIGGNMLLTDSLCIAGEKGLTRFARDVADRPSVRSVIVLLGTNDIGLGDRDFGCGAFPLMTAPRLIEGHRALIRAAHSRGIKIIGATLPPFKGAEPYYDEAGEHEKVRDAVNQWIRHSGEYDAVVDVDKVLADAGDPDALSPAYNSGDNLHPNDAGMKAIARAIDPRTL
ncbi:SGNH/GDSL hydrolase family protein [Actinomadura sp. HBU206391]|uniref:SGNH/GDSL hydrolase family protein n=1 Tax=Actinomadura sp. HBU206391 TaxID=2731692 RepID=UPI00165042CE|nr:SGNH/GDSL hydrolase family protein [Actinomadura sp. HBU206391]MBC6457387.1 SGNH/GDSL hydrolase family protein [Actinomadura sp. HBU206391]